MSLYSSLLYLIWKGGFVFPLVYTFIDWFFMCLDQGSIHNLSVLGLGWCSHQLSYLARGLSFTSVSHILYISVTSSKNSNCDLLFIEWLYRISFYCARHSIGHLEYRNEWEVVDFCFILFWFSAERGRNRKANPWDTFWKILLHRYL